MRLKTRKVVITFKSNNDIMLLDSIAKNQGIPGRIIPIPSSISAGCGLAWCADIFEKQTLLSDLADAMIPFQGIYELEMF